MHISVLCIAHVCNCTHRLSRVQLVCSDKCGQLCTYMCNMLCVWRGPCKWMCSIRAYNSPVEIIFEYFHDLIMRCLNDLSCCYPHMPCASCVNSYQYWCFRDSQLFSEALTSDSVVPSGLGIIYSKHVAVEKSKYMFLPVRRWTSLPKILSIGNFHL